MTTTNPVDPLRRMPKRCTSAVLLLMLTACGGGGGGGGGSDGEGASSATSTERRIAAATATAQSSTNPCAADVPFYWEVGDGTSKLASGSVNSKADATVYTATTQMAIASASKWLYAAHVVQKQNAVLSDSDIKFLNFRSGYTNPASCKTAASTPVPASESWHYSLGHWVEDDPAVGDGAFSSAGAFGFYPWIDASKQWYGIVARHVVGDGEGFDSAASGRLIRKAWITGLVQ